MVCSGSILFKEDDPLDNPVAVNPNTNKQQTGSSANDLLSDKSLRAW
jgi:hypothetical protein